MGSILKYKDLVEILDNYRGLGNIVKGVKPKYHIIMIK